jgi:Ni,Fe-hydrogenase III large subunit/Ni,Fe-hydrogenase III component G
VIAGADHALGTPVPGPGGCRSHAIDAAGLSAVARHAVATGWRFASLVADLPAPDRIRLDYAFVAAHVRVPVVLRLELAADAPRVVSIAEACPAASWAEREVADMFGVAFVGSPDPRPLLHHEDWPAGLHPLRAAADVSRRIERTGGTYRYDLVEGDGVMEIRVGPIHAGIIEPGQFRFSAVGETVLGLEIRLGYVHRGVELAARDRPPEGAVVLAERISGTASVAHAVACARAIEAALAIEVPPAHALFRTFLVELERLYNHVGDLANLCAGTALSAVGAEGMELKERLLAANAALTGSRYLRGAIGIGGVRRPFDPDAIDAAVATAESVGAATDRFADKFFSSASNLERLTGTGVLSAEHARNLGTVGIVARASGLAIDSRADLDHPTPIDREVYARLIPVTEHAGDVAARARVRLYEARAGIAVMRAIAARLVVPQAEAPRARPRADGEGYGWCEGARGEILTYVRLAGGRVARLKVRSPSRMNWPAIEHAMPGNIVPDFPLINKSFNLSYAGCDL